MAVRKSRDGVPSTINMSAWLSAMPGRLAAADPTIVSDEVSNVMFSASVNPAGLFARRAITPLEHAATGARAATKRKLS